MGCTGWIYGLGHLVSNGGFTGFTGQVYGVRREGLWVSHERFTGRRGTVYGVGWAGFTGWVI